MSFDSVADGLYALAPEDFIKERTAAEKQARGDGDRELAARIHRLGKPTIVGWIANQLVGRRAAEIGPLLELGAGLREATANLSGEKLHELTRLQHQVIAGLIKQARQIAKDEGQRLSEDAVRALEATLRAALADEELGAQLAAGRLTGGLEHVGFGVDITATNPAPRVAKQSPQKGQTPPKTDELAARRKAKLADAERAVDEARTEAQSSHRAHKQAESQLEKAASALAERAEKVAKLQAELDEANVKKDAAAQAETEARKAAELAEKDAERRRQELEAAEAKRDELAR